MARPFAIKKLSQLFGLPSLQGVLEAVVFPQEFGAKGDENNDDSVAIQSAIDFANSISDIDCYVLVYLPKGRYKITSQLVVKSGVCLHCDGVLVNHLADKFQPAVVFKPHSAASKIRLWGNLGSGVVFGEEGEYSDIIIGDVRLWNIGEEYDPEKGAKIAVKFTGYNFKFNSLDVDGGNIGVDLELASDVKGDKILTYTASLGMRITSACEHISIASVTIDTPDWRGLQIDSSHDIYLGNVDIFINDQVVVSGSLDYAAVIGEYSASDNVDNLFMNLRVQNTGGVALKVSNIRDSIINLSATNSHLATGNTYPIATGVEFGSGIVNTAINFMASDDITPYSGTPAGMYARFSENSVEFLSPLRTLGKLLGIGQSYTPSGSDDPTGREGDLAWDDDYLYLKTSAGWKKIPLSAL